MWPTQAPTPEENDWILVLCQGIKEMKQTIMLLLLFLSSLLCQSLMEFEVQVKEKRQTHQFASGLGSRFWFLSEQWISQFCASFSDLHF